MAIIRNPYGDLRKRLGNTVTLINDGVNIVRKMPGQVRDAKTPLQVQQRAKFTTLTQVGKALQRTLELGYTLRVTLTGPFAQFIKVNKECVTISAMNQCTVDYSRLIVSKGIMPKYYLSVTYDTDLSEFVFTQDPYVFDNKYELDSTAYATLYNTAEGREYCIKLKAVVAGGETTVGLPTGWRKEDVKVYTFTRNDKMDVSSGSLYHEV
ncbi:MAG: DUF6266 family protein [Marinifilaceae bacterium]